MSYKIMIEQKVLSENDRLAAEIRQRLRKWGITSINFVSSPGSGKTSLLAKTLMALNNRMNVALIAGDVQTENDAIRLTRAGGKIVKSIVTGGACHLDARMVGEALEAMTLGDVDLLLIENVGNLVCPASYDLGENMKVVLISTTEGDDKPLKYPAMFRRSSIAIINKIDLVGYSDFSLDHAKQNAWKINPDLKIFEVSCYSDFGLTEWYEWLATYVRDNSARNNEKIIFDKNKERS
jgi:hydrogenase nickel incorporation protein HypB